MTQLIVNAVILIVIAIVVIVLLAQTFYLVKTNQVAVVERFGRFTRMGRAGLNVKIPFVDQIVNRLSLRVMQLDEMVSTITSDKVTVRLNVSVQYRVSEIVEHGPQGPIQPTVAGGSLYRANYSLTDVEDQISSYIFDAVRSTVPNKSLDEVFAEKDHIAQAVNNQLSTTMGQYGYEIVRTLVTGVSPDQEVEQAMNRINAAERLKEASRAEAQAYRIKIVGQAEGDRDAKKLSGEGVALQREQIAQGLARQHEVLAEAGVVNADMVLLMNQYFDAMVSIAERGGGTTVFLPGGADAVSDIGTQIRNATLQATSAMDGTGPQGTPPKLR